MSLEIHLPIQQIKMNNSEISPEAKHQELKQKNQMNKKANNKATTNASSQVAESTQLQDKNLMSDKQSNPPISSQIKHKHQNFIKIKWNPQKTSKNIILENDNLRTSLSQQRYIFRTTLSAQGFYQGIHYWEVQTYSVTNSQFKVGVSGNDKFDLDTAFCDYDFGWACCHDFDQVENSSKATGQQNGIKYTKQRVIGVYLNMQLGMIAFSLDGKNMGVAHIQESLKKGPLYPAVALFHKGRCSIRGQLPIPEIFKDPRSLDSKSSMNLPQQSIEQKINNEIDNQNQSNNSVASSHFNQLRQEFVHKTLPEHKNHMKKIQNQNIKKQTQIVQKSIKSSLQHIFNQIIIKKSIPNLEKQSKLIIQSLNEIHMIVKSTKITAQKLAQLLTLIGAQIEKILQAQQEKEAFELLYSHIILRILNQQFNEIMIDENNKEKQRLNLMKRLQKIQVILQKQE